MMQERLNHLIQDPSYLLDIRHDFNVSIYYTSGSAEDYSYLARMNSHYLSSEFDAFLVLQERLLYKMEEWPEDDLHKNDQRLIAAYNFLIPTWRQMGPRIVSWNEFINRIHGFDIAKDELFQVSNKQFAVSLLIDQWNWIEAFGRIGDEYFYMIWFTTA